MNDQTLYVGPNVLLVFIDETGIEDLSDPNNPTFGIAGCAILGRDYEGLLVEPWKLLKKVLLGRVDTLFHATVLQRASPSAEQIQAINEFVLRPFWRFAVTCDTGTALGPGVDAHKAVATAVTNFILRRAQQIEGLTDIALVFEHSMRGKALVERDFANTDISLENSRGDGINIEGFFIEKSAMVGGLEIADLIAHTAGRQSRRRVSSSAGWTRDFEVVFRRPQGLAAFMHVVSATRDQPAPK